MNGDDYLDFLKDKIRALFYGDSNRFNKFTGLLQNCPYMDVLGEDPDIIRYIKRLRKEANVDLHFRPYTMLECMIAVALAMKTELKTGNTLIYEFNRVMAFTGFNAYIFDFAPKCYNESAVKDILFALQNRQPYRSIPNPMHIRTSISLYGPESMYKEQNIATATLKDLINYEKQLWRNGGKIK